MKFSKLWLNELIKADFNSEKLAEQLTMAGLEVSQVMPVAAEFHGVVIGNVLTVDRHPNADKLSLCKIDIGGAGDNLSIVCGAPNVRPQMKVPVALVGAVLPGDFKIKKSKLRGVESEGMLCSAGELGLVGEAAGIFELPNDAPIGIDIRKYLMLDDAIFEVDLTANRGDCLSIVGIAREVAAINRIPVTQLKSYPEKLLNDSKNANNFFPITITAQDACPHYCGLVVRGINNRIDTPILIKERLQRLGIRSINLVVDITNYVMLELGQPLHAFDLKKMQYGINVRYAKQGETITLLDGRILELDNKTLVIADLDQPVALAGVMGGDKTGVSQDTVDIFLESAFFVPEKIVGVVQRYNLQTDSSHRYVRGVDYNLQLQALNYAASLIEEIAGGNFGAVTEIVAEEYLPKSSPIILRRQAIKNILGSQISDKEVADILSHLGMKVAGNADGWLVVSPSWRFDIKIEEDLVEEIARVHGYHFVPEEKIIANIGVNSGKKTSYLDRNRLCTLLEDLGYHEVITFSFIDAKLQELFDSDHQALQLVNPISAELSVMRTTLLPGLVNAVKYNSKRQQQRARFFEVGLRFLQKESGAVDQELAIAGIIFGNLYPEQWGLKQQHGNFFDLKNDVERILKIFVANNAIEYIAKSNSAFHPTKTAQICVAGVPIGYLGELHPMIKQKLELPKETCIFEIGLSGIINESKDVFKMFSRFPKVQRDIAIVVDKNVPWAQIRQKIVDISKELLQNITLFDVYCSENIGLNKRSMAIRLIFQSVSRTLVDAEVESLVDHIVLGLKQTFDASLRG